SITNVQNLQVLERMVMGNDQVAVYDNGHYNTSVRPTLEDLGIGATIGPNNLPLSNSRFFQKKVKERVAAMMAEAPDHDDDVDGFSLEKAIRVANQEAGVPRILARPAEAAILLSKAADLLGNPSTVIDLLHRADALLVASTPDPTGA